MHKGMQYDPIQGEVHNLLKFGNPVISNPISSVIYNGNWKLTTIS